MKMRKFSLNKLLRDKLIEKREREGSKFHYTILNDQEFDKQLKVKLDEETQEVVVAQSKTELIEELADVMEVIDALCALHGFTPEEIAAVQAKKRDERGGFAGRKFVTIAEHPVGSWAEQYCLAQPKKYPEIKD